MEKEYNEKFKKHQIATKKLSEAKLEREQKDAEKTARRDELDLLIRDFDNKKKRADEDRKEIEQKMRERDLLNKDVVNAEEEERKKQSAIQTLENELKKLQNKI